MSPSMTISEMNKNLDATTTPDSPDSDNRLTKVRILSVPQTCSEKRKLFETKTEEHWQVGNTGQDKLEIL